MLNHGFEEVYGLEKVIFLIYCDVELQAVAEDGKTIFYANTEDKNYDDAVIKWLNASHDVRCEMIDYNKYLRCQRYVKKIMAMNKK